MANNTLLASDSFSSGLAAGWASYAGVSDVCQVVAGSPNVTEAKSTSTVDGQIWTGLSWTADQISEVTIQNLTSSSLAGYVTLVVRQSNSTHANYQLNIEYNYNAGTPILSASVYVTASGGSTTQLGSSVTGLTFAAGDVWSFGVFGSVLTVYQNYKQIFRYSDTTVTSGYPGFAQYATTTTANSQVSSWRGYSAVQQDGIWQKQGIVLPGVSGDFSSGAGGQANTAMLYEGNAQILSGTVYKMWFCTGSPGAEDNVFYAESSDGITWTRYGSAVIASFASPFIIKSGSTYYMYVQPVNEGGTGNFAQYTSTDGINWSQQSSNVFGKGTSGQWDDTIIWYFQPLAIISGTWYAIYSGGHDLTSYQLSLGLATSSDGLTWTRHAGNPVLTGGGSGSVVNSAAFTLVGSTYYMWMFGNQPGFGGNVPNLDPGEGIRYQTTDFINWTNPIHSVHRSQLYEGVNFNYGQCYPNNIFTVGNDTYMYVQSAVSDNSAPQIYQISLAIAGAPISTIVQGTEDAVVQVANDGFTSGTGPLSANWTTPTGATAITIVAGPYAEPSVGSATDCEAVYTGGTFGNDQYSEITIRTLAVNCSLSPCVRMSASSLSYYEMRLGGPTGGTYSLFSIYKNVNGTQTSISPTQTVTTQVGDVFRISVVGNVISVFQNGFMIQQVNDNLNSVTTGKPGFKVSASTVNTATVQVSLWAGGNANVVPAAVDTTTFSPVAGTYSNAQTVTFVNADSALPGFAMYWNTTGSPTTGSTLYTGPITVSTSETVYVLAVANQQYPSAIASAAYVINGPVTTTTFSPGAGAYINPQTVTFINADSALSGFAMYYTTDGSTPTISSTLYSTPISVSVSETIKVLAVATGYANSAIAAATYSINGQVTTTTFSPGSGTYPTSAIVTFLNADSALSGFAMYWNTTGNPTPASTLYNGPITITTSETIYVLAVASNYSNSNIATASYTITNTVSQAVFNPPSGTYFTAQTVTLTNPSFALPGFAMYWNNTGNPTTGSTLYTGPIIVNTSQTIYVLAVASGYLNSPIASAVYVLTTITQPTVSCAQQVESQVNGYSNLGKTDMVHYISDGIVASWIDYQGNPGGNLLNAGTSILLGNNNIWQGVNTFPTIILNPITFANLGIAVPGTMQYCSDCYIGNPCTSGGTGAIAKYLNSVWVC